MSTPAKGQRLLLCNCQRTMEIAAGTLSRAIGLDAPPTVHSELCRGQLAAFKQALLPGAALHVACTQEAPLFREVAAEAGGNALTFTNIREHAGWSADGARAGAKMAALLAAGALAPKPTGLTTLKSTGVCLLYGSGQAALDVAAELAHRLSVTVLLRAEGEAMPPAVAAVPIFKGRIRTARGHLGHFEVEVDGYAPMLPSSRAALHFAPACDGARASCDVIFDISGTAPLFADGRRDGYVRADPGQAAAVARAMFQICDLVGEFEKPLYVRYERALCAHARSHKVGCSKCLEACPTGAITPDGDGVAIAPAVCGGCGSCSAVCPTDAVSYAYPQRSDLLARLGVLLKTYRAAQGERPIVVFHDEKEGSAQIDAMARFGDGLPANALPLGLFSVLQLGHETLAQALACGAEHIVVLASGVHAAELAALEGEIAILDTLLAALGFAGPRLHLLRERDPDGVAALLHGLAPLRCVGAESHAAIGSKREVARGALARLRAEAPTPRDIVALPEGAPYGSIEVDVAGCTLCLSCVGACPTGALSDDPDRPQLAFTESACVQCGICVATCPEKVIRRVPRYSFLSSAMSPRLIKHEEPFLCVSCGKPFGTRSSIARVIARLKGAHAMFQTEAQLRLIEMCDTCRIRALAESGDDPFKGPPRPRVRTREDYLAEDAEQGQKGPAEPDDFLS